MTDGPQRRISRKDVFPADRTALSVRRARVDGDHAPHDHDFLEVALILGGTGRHLSPRGEQALAPGDVFLLRPGAWHTYRACDGLEVYNCCFGRELLHGELAAFSEVPALHYLFWAGPLSLDVRGLIALHLPPASLAACCGHLDAIAASDDDPAGGTLDRIGHLLLFLGQLARCLGPEFRAPDARPTLPHPAVSEGRRMLEEDLAHAWTLAELASRLCIDPSYLSRLFRDGLGLPPMASLARCRAERAARLLVRTDAGVGEVGEQVGWPDPNYFARRFRAAFGMSATAYRARFAQPAPLVSGTDEVQSPEDG